MLKYALIFILMKVVPHTYTAKSLHGYSKAKNNNNMYVGESFLG